MNTETIAAARLLQAMPKLARARSLDELRATLQEAVGADCVLDENGRCSWSATASAGEGGLLQIVAGVAEGAAQRLADLAALRAQVENLSVTDELTGLHNRRGFYLLAEKLLVKAKREGGQCVLAFIDVDGLKRVNDKLGHERGDEMIVDVANVLRSTLRESDVIARLGGDEFCVLAADPVVDGTGMCWRFLTMLEETNRALKRPYRLSASVGYSSTAEMQGETLDQLILRADGRMVEDKRSKGQARVNA